MKLNPWEPDLLTIVNRIDAAEIDLQPNFQRQEIWPLSKKKRLIDTILRGWSIPPVFLVVVKDGRMEVLDGQQRLAAIRDFVHDVFSIDGKITPTDNIINQMHGMYYRSLNTTQRRLINNHTLRCFQITDYLPDEPSELFYRLNQPSMLTAGEQRNAFYGKAREQLKELVVLFEKGGNDKSTIGFSNVRLAYDDIIARLLYFLEIGSFSVKGTEVLISQRFKERGEFSDEVIKRAVRCIEYFTVDRRTATTLRLNKASALSWLLFYSRVQASVFRPNFMEYFYISSKNSKSKYFISQAIALFYDRASLRVTDVSSVVYRDFVLWYTYFFGARGAVPSKIDESILQNVLAEMTDHEDVSFEKALNKYVDITGWGKLE